MFSGQERNSFWLCSKHCFGRMFAAACSFGRLCRLCAACCNWDSRAWSQLQFGFAHRATKRVWGASVVRWRHRTRLLRSDADASLCLEKGLERNKRCACSLLSWAWAFPRRPHTLTRPPALGMLSVARSSYGTQQTTAHAPPAHRIEFSNVVCVCVCVCGVTECPVTNLFFVNRGTIHLLCAMVQRSGHSKCGYRG